MQALMQAWPLTVDKILDHAKNWHGRTEVVGRSSQGRLLRTTYAEVHARAKRFSNVLSKLGLGMGDRVATLAWNGTRHLEVWYGAMGMGAVCHTLNPRLAPEHLVYVINEARDRLLLVDSDLLPIVAGIRARIPSVEHVIVLAEEDDRALQQPDMLCYERLLAHATGEFTWGAFDENTAAGLCFTSGTSGQPKGVLYSHRSQFLHALFLLTADVFGLSALDTVMPIVPMFHANAWGLAFAAPAVGAKLVFPGNRLDGASVHELLERERVTFAAAVPTVWLGLLEYLRSGRARLSALRRICVGGSAVPEIVVREFQDRYGVEVRHAWGMTEMSPLGTASSPNQSILRLGAADRFRWSLKQGRPPLGVEMKITDDDGNRLPCDGATMGRLKVRGAAVAAAYFNQADRSSWDAEEFFDTGDVATIDEHGAMQIVDRTKDVIKSGGEWISSVAIENAMMGHPKVALAAALAVPHPQWGERPALFVRLKEGESAREEELRQFLLEKLPKWWLPDAIVFVADVPLGATGKIDKKALRQSPLAQTIVLRGK